MLRKFMKDSVSRRAHFFKFALNLGLDMARRFAGMSKQEVARRMGVDQAVVSRFPLVESNHTVLSVARYLEAIEADYELIIRVKGKELRIRPDASEAIEVRDWVPLEYVWKEETPQIRFRVKKSMDTEPPHGARKDLNHGYTFAGSA